MSGKVNEGESQQTNNRSLRSAVRVTNLFCAWHCVAFHRPPGQRGVKCCLDKWQTLLPWCLAEFTSTQSGPCNGREDKEGVAEGKNQRRVNYLDKQGRGRDREMSNGRDGSYRDNGKIGYDTEVALLILLLFNCLAVLSWLGPRTQVPVESPQPSHRRQTPL